MINLKSLRLVTLSALVLGILLGRAEGGPTSGLYQIVSGRYAACCGIAGPIIEELPNVRHACIELTLDSENKQAQMRFLGQDGRTVLSIPAQSCRNEFTYVFTNGIVFPDRIQFGEPGVPPQPDQPSFSFVVSNKTDTLSINGTVIAPCPGSADLPVEFQHTNVLAVLMPAATVRVSAVEVCWATVSNRTYQVQYRSILTTNAWTDLGAPVAGNGQTQCLTDPVPSGRPERYYRVVRLP